MRRTSPTTHFRRTNERSGVAATEFAVCLPILLVLIIGTLEACSMVYLKQTLSISAYEGARAALQPNAVTSEVEDACETILTSRSVNGATITISPNNFESAAEGTWITIEVTARGGDNTIIAGWFYDNLVVNGQATMMKEF